MTGTPYAAPAARVADPVEKITERPPSIRLAVLFLWISMGLAIGMQALRFPAYLQMVRSGAMTPADLAGQIGGTAFSCAIVILVALKVGAGRNWARWLYLALYVLGTGLTLLTFAVMPRMLQYLTAAPIAAASVALQTVLQTVALAAMFVRPSREWFAAQRKK